MKPKTVTVVVPTYNEQDNIPIIYQRITDVFVKEIPQYQLELLFIDNCSTDSSRKHILALAKADGRVKAIFNARNFGFSRSSFYGLTQATGDCAVLMYADMQDPPEIIPELIKHWESGYKIVVGIKNSSRENPIMYWIRKTYYSLLKKISEIEHIDQFDGFGLYDCSFIKIIGKLDDSLPYLRGIVSELGFQWKEVLYVQDKRQHGKTKFSFFKMYDLAMLGITSYSKMLMRLATMIGFGVAIVSLIIAAITLVFKVTHWDSFPIGNAAISIGVFFFGAVQLFFIGLLGEYVLSINIRTMHHPLVIEDERINF